MRLPCERYLRLCCLRGYPQATLSQVLERLGYPPAATVPELLAYVATLSQEVASLGPQTGEPRRDVQDTWQLVAVYRAPEVLRELEYLLPYADIYAAMSAAVLAGNHPLAASRLVRELSGAVVAPEVLALFAHLILDLTLLTPWETELFFEIHACGKEYRRHRLLGRAGVVFFQGGVVDFEAEECLTYMAQGCFLAYKQLQLQDDPARLAGPITAYVQAVVKLYDKLGAGVASRRLQAEMRRFGVLARPLDPLCLGPGLHVAGLLGGRVTVAAAHEATEYTKQQVTKVLPSAPPTNKENGP